MLPIDQAPRVLQWEMPPLELTVTPSNAAVSFLSQTVGRDNDERRQLVSRSEIRVRTNL
jgi:hypothetical protein